MLLPDISQKLDIDTPTNNKAELIAILFALQECHKNNIKEKIIFVCQMGVRSALACEISSAYGVDEGFLFNLEGGMNEWITNGFEVE